MRVMEADIIIKEYIRRIEGLQFGLNALRHTSKHVHTSCMFDALDTTCEDEAIAHNDCVSFIDGL